MPASIAPIPVSTTMQNAQSSVGNGTSFDVTGAQRVLLWLRGSASLTGGALAIEISRDSGVTWDRVPYGFHDFADSQINQTADYAVTGTGDLLKLGVIQGPALIRARISTAITGGTITVRGIRIG